MRATVDGQAVLSFCSNDYLGLASHPALIAALCQGATEAGVGSGASHLITGHHQYHEQLEQSLVDFSGLPAALLFSSGYLANLAVISSLMRRDDAIFADRLNHASLNDAAVLSRARLQRYPHNDMQALAGLLQASSARHKLVVADAVFSMDGDLAPVPELLALCEQYDAWLLLDDAHGFGVLGEGGRGILEHFRLASPRIIYMATLGKAAGVYGAFVGAESTVVDYLLQKARPYIYTTATPPALAAALLAALPIIAHATDRRRHLLGLIQLLQGGLKLKRWQLAPSSTAIQPLMVGANREAQQLADYLLQHGMLVPAIRPPTVPVGSARLRISLSAAHTKADVQGLIDLLQQAERELLS